MPLGDRPVRARRTALPATLAAAVLALTASVLAAAPAQARTIVKAAPSTSVAVPLLNERFTISGSLGASKARWAELQQKVGAKWVKRERTWIPASGRYSYPLIVPGGTTVWRVIARKSGTSPKRVTYGRYLTRGSQSTSFSAPTAIKAGSTVSITATSSPARPGRSVQLQVDTGSGWTVSSTGAENASGQTTFSLATSSAGVVQYRTLEQPTANGVGGHLSAAATLDVVPTTAPAVAAHRGFSSYYPENTLLAYTGALDNGTDWLETDFQQTAPDTEAEVADSACSAYGVTTAGATHFIALHDSDFTRTTDVETKFPIASYPTKYSSAGKPLVENFTLCEIKQLDAGAWKSASFSTSTYGSLTQVPTLEETLTLLSGSTKGAKTRIMLEPKYGTVAEAKALYDAVVAFDQAHASTSGYQPYVDVIGHDDRALFDTFNFDVAAALEDPTQAPGAEVATVVDDASELDPATSAGAVMVLVNQSLASAEAIKAYNEASLPVYVWTVDTPETWFHLAALGASGIITNNSKGMTQRFAALLA
ncbi:MAG: glycerophosphodiester phosphodiesterase family protein [Nocardioides sp.]|uniref:glycerophosphodiester phosphodiesterase n=1 Tax=Nocardioides sp. TaxID=35761 RepID=UPI0039E45A64